MLIKTKCWPSTVGEYEPDQNAKYLYDALNIKPRMTDAQLLQGRHRFCNLWWGITHKSQYITKNPVTSVDSQ